jgi:hypothetical protein
MSGGMSSINLIYFQLFSFNYGRITLKFQKLSGGHYPHSAVLGSTPGRDIYGRQNAGQCRRQEAELAGAVAEKNVRACVVAGCSVRVCATIVSDGIWGAIPRSLRARVRSARTLSVWGAAHQEKSSSSRVE